MGKAILQVFALIAYTVYALGSWVISTNKKSKAATMDRVRREQAKYRVMEYYDVDETARFVDCGHSHESIATAFACRQTRRFAEIEAIDETGMVRPLNSAEVQEFQREQKRWMAQHVRVGRPLARLPRAFSALRAGEPNATEAKYRSAVEGFRTQIERHRARTLGHESEWAGTRASLTEAVEDARGSMAYWRARLGQDPGNQMVAGQLKTATELHAKLRSALDKLDGRAGVLLKFYQDCEARITVMERHNHDIEEIRRLERLSGSADTVIAGAETALGGIGASFLREARQVGEVIGAFERLQLKSLVGEAPLDDIEFLADRINESSERQFETVQQLSRTIEKFAQPTG